MAQYEAVSGGLRVSSDGHGWDVTHAASGLGAVTGLRQRRFAEQARAELLATGVDFTASPRELQERKTRKRWRDVYYRWQARAKAEDVDPETFEYYPWHCSYGQFIPSAAWARKMRDAVARKDGETIADLWNQTSHRTAAHLGEQAS